MAVGGPQPIIFSDKERIVYRNLLSLQVDLDNPASQAKFKSNFDRMTPVQKLRYTEYSTKVMSAKVAKTQAEYDRIVDKAAREMVSSLRKN